MTTGGKSRLWEFLDQGLFRDLGLPALVASLVLFVSAMSLLGANVSELRTSYERVQRTNDTLLQIAMINADILRIEMTVRGYALSGDPNYIGWLTQSQQGLEMRLAKLDAALNDNAHEHHDVVMLTKLSNEHCAFFTDMLKLVATDRNQVIAKMVDYSKQVKRRPMEDLLNHLRHDEGVRLAELAKGAEARVVSAYRYAVAISAIALILGGFGFALILHDRRAGPRVRD